MVGVPAARGEGLDPRNPAGPQAGGLHLRIHQAQVEGAATNQLSGESVDFFGRSSNARYGEANPVAVPSLVMQGSVDTLFDLTEAVGNFDHVRDRAPARLVAFCSGHVSCPDSYADADDRAFLDAAILDWFARYLKGQDTDTGPPVSRSGSTSRCRASPRPSLVMTAVFLFALVMVTSRVAAQLSRPAVRRRLDGVTGVVFIGFGVRLCSAATVQAELAGVLGASSRCVVPSALPADVCTFLLHNLDARCEQCR